MASFHNLPVEVQEQIFLNLNRHDLKNCSLVSSTWYYIINSNRIWQKICERERIADKSFLHDHQRCFKNPLREYSSDNHFVPMCYWKSHFSRYKFLKRNWRTGRYVTVHLPLKPIHISERFVVEDLYSSLKIWEVCGEIKEFCSVPNVFPGVKIDNFSSNENFMVYTQQRHLLCLKKSKSSFKQQFQIEVEYKKCRHYRGCARTISSDLAIRLTEKFILVLDPAMPCSLKFYTFGDNITHKSIDLHKTLGNPTSFSSNIWKVTKEKVFFSYTISWEQHLITYDLIRETWDSPIVLDFNIIDIYPSEKYVCVKMFSEGESIACVWDHSVKTSPPLISSLLVSEDSPVVFTSQDMIIFGRRGIFTGYDIIVRGLVCNYVRVLSLTYEVHQFCPVWDKYLVVLSEDSVSVWEWDKQSKINTLFRDADLIESSYCDFHDISIEEKRRAILDKITSEPKVADLKLTFYMAACESMSDSGRTLVPSPKEYLSRRPLKEALQEVNESIPNLRLLRLYLARPDTFHISDDAISLLYWLLIRLKEPGLIPLEDQENWPDFSNSDDISAGDSLRKPDMILKVRYSSMSTRQMQWKSRSFGKKTMDAYTAVRLEDVHSTLHCGPKRLVEMGGLGYGLSLCSKLSGCLSRTKPSWTWGKSCLATKMSVVMMIQFADNSQKVLRLAHHQPVFYLISDPSYARIRYLFIWINSPPPRLPDLPMPLDNKTNMQFLLSSLVLVSSLFLPKEAPVFLQNSLCTLTALGERLLKHH